MSTEGRKRCRGGENYRGMSGEGECRKGVSEVDTKGVSTGPGRQPLCPGLTSVLQLLDQLAVPAV